MLKKYIERADQDGAPQQNSENNQIMSCDVCTRIIGGNEDLCVNNDEMMQLSSEGNLTGRQVGGRTD